MNIEIIQVPYDSGHYCARTGCGPDYFVDNGLPQLLQEQGYRVNTHRVVSTASLNTENGTGFELNRHLAEHVEALDENSFPLILSGNCNSCVGGVAGLSRHDLGVIWFDAHGDFNTPETTMNGFLDGMGLAMVTGRCWRTMLRKIPGFRAVAERNVIQVGALDLDAAEARMFKEAGIPVITFALRTEHQFFLSFQEAIDDLANRVKNVYVHIDMDVLDIGPVKANHLAVPGGLSVAMVSKCLELLKESFTIRGCGIASLDPAFDRERVVLNAGFRLIAKVLER